MCRLSNLHFFGFETLNHCVCFLTFFTRNFWTFKSRRENSLFFWTFPHKTTISQKERCYFFLLRMTHKPFTNTLPRPRYTYKYFFVVFFFSLLVSIQKILSAIFLKLQNFTVLWGRLQLTTTFPGLLITIYIKWVQNTDRKVLQKNIFTQFARPTRETKKLVCNSPFREWMSEEKKYSENRNLWVCALWTCVCVSDLELLTHTQLPPLTNFHGFTRINADFSEIYFANVTVDGFSTRKIHVLVFSAKTLSSIINLKIFVGKKKILIQAWQFPLNISYFFHALSLWWCWWMVFERKINWSK